MVNIIESPSKILPNLGVNINQDKTEKYKMTAKAILQCRPNSHPFPERTLLLDQPLKIGRSVAKAKPAANNAIFDCKVLSRNHAILWYEHGKFYLKDTKSSNGTFVNNQRLSKGSEESIPREVCSSDIVQFGVDVVEDFKKVQHGCVIATLKLYLPDGQEAKASSITAESGSACTITLQEFYVLRSCLEEANLKEQQINAKLTTLLNAVNSAHDVAFHGWSTMVDEDILLQRLELLQGQLATFSKSYPEGDAKADVRQLQEDKAQIEINAKQSVAKILKEKLYIEIQCADLERKDTSMNIELDSLKDLLVSYKSEIDDLLERHDIQSFEIQELSDQLKTAEGELKLKMDGNNEGEERNEATDEVTVVIERLKAENDVIKEKCNVIKSKYENLKNAHRLSDIEVEGPVADANRIYEQLRHTLRNLRDKFREAQDDTPEVQAAISRLTRDLEQTIDNDAKYLIERKNLEEELIELKGKLHADASIAEHFQNVEASSYKKLSIFMDGVLAGNTISKAEIVKDIENNQTDECVLLKNVGIGGDNVDDKNETHIQLCIYVVTSLQEEIRKAAEAARQAQNSRLKAEEKLDQVNKKHSVLCEAQVSANSLSTCLRQRLATKEGFIQNKTMYLNDVLDHMTQLESVVDHIHDHFYCLANNLVKEREETEKLRNEVNSVNRKLEARDELSYVVAREAEKIKTERNSNKSQIEENCNEQNANRELVDEGDTDTIEVELNRQHTKEALISDNQENSTLSEEHLSIDSSPILPKNSENSNEPSSDSFHDQLTALKKENNRLRSQLSVQNEEFSDLAMRNQIVIPTWFLTIFIGVIYYSWTIYSFFYN